MWTIEAGHHFDEETYTLQQAWHVVDDEGEPIHTFREKEDAEEWMAGRLEAWAEQEAEAAAERRWERGER